MAAQTLGSQPVNAVNEYIYDSTNDKWVPMLGDSTGNTPVVGNVASGATDSGNPVKVGGKYNSTPPSFTNGQRGDLQITSFGQLKVTPSAGGNDADVNGTSNARADAVGLYVSAQNLAFNGSTWDRAVKSNTTFRILTAAASTNGNNIKGSAGNVHKIIVNVVTAGKFLKFYNKATAPTVGTDTPVMTIPLPTAGLVQIDFGQTGHYFSLGIGMAVTGAIADADATALLAGDFTGFNVTYS